MYKFAILAVIAGALVATDTPAQAAAKCTSIQARCAVKIGGECDPATGKWAYGSGPGRPRLGGNIVAFNACVSEELASQKKR